MAASIVTAAAPKFCLRTTQSNVNVVKSFAYNALRMLITFFCAICYTETMPRSKPMNILQQVTPPLSERRVNATRIHDEWFIIVSHNGHYNHMFISFLLMLLLYRLIRISNEGKSMQQCCVCIENQKDSIPFVFFLISWWYCVFGAQTHAAQRLTVYLP